MKFRQKHILISFILLFFPAYLFSQGIAIGEWRDHLPYNSCVSVTEGDGMVYCATSYAVFSVDRNENSIQRLTKINYLSDIGVSRVAYHDGLNTLVVTYTNGNIDLIENQTTVTNISDIKNKPIPGNKTINNVLFIGNTAYLACGFGIVVLDLVKKEIKDTYYIGPGGSQIEVFDITTNDTLIWAATESGIYYAELSNPYLSNYTYWSKDTLLPQPGLAYNCIEYFDNSLYANLSDGELDGDTIYKYHDGNWDYFDSTSFLNRYGIHTFNNKLLIIEESYIKIVSPVDTIKIGPYIPGTSSSPRDAVIDNEDHNWIADQYLGVVENWDMWNASFYQPDGPGTANVIDMSVEGRKLWVAPGGVDAAWNNLFKHDGIFSFTNEDWNTFDFGNTAAFDTIYDVLCVAVNPSNPSKAYAGTWSRGIMEFTDNTLTAIYDESNSTLIGTGTDESYRLKVGGITFDSGNNMWVTNTGVNTALHVRMADGSWKAFNFSGYINTDYPVSDIAIDLSDQKWIILPKNTGILVFNDNGTITTTADDQIKKLTNSSGNGGLPSNNIFSIAVDLDGEVWVGTDKGVAVFYNPENVFSGNNFDAQQILVDQDGFIQPLLESEIVSAIAVDGANRKWIGTQRAGVFLMSDDGTTELVHFTEDNSPLFTNTINAISINHQTGEVFFGTDKGIISFKSTATEGSDEDTSVVVYPNPVPENYTGYIGIKGLAANSDIKITDISGTLIYKTIAEGGQAIWNGCNFQGEKAKTGVYLVFCSNEDGSQTVVAKIMIIN